MRRLVLLIAVAALAASAWLVFGSNASELAPLESESDQPDMQVESSVDMAGESVAAKKAKQPEDAAAARSQLELNEASAAKESEMLRILVIHKETKEPVADAKVSYYDGAAIQYSDMSPEEQVEYERLARDREKLAHKFGTTVASNSEGVVFIQFEKKESYLLIVGRHDSLYGEKAFTWNLHEEGEKKEIKLELEPDRELRVQVLDSLGNPAVGVPLVIRPGNLDVSSYYFGQSGQSEAPEGMALIPHLQIAVHNWRRVGEDSTDFALIPFIPGFVEGGLVFDTLEPPSDPLVLRLPPTGRILLKTVDTEGEPLATERGRVSLAMLPDDPLEDLSRYQPRQGWQWRAKPSDDGLSLFDWVVTGKPFLGMANLPGERVREVFSGPQRVGEEVTLTLSSKRRNYNLVGRLLNEEQEPLINKRFRGSYQTAKINNRNLNFTTDDQGRFMVNAGREGQEVTLEKLTIVRETNGQKTDDAFAMYSMQRSIPLVLGKNDLGDLVLGASPLVASGRILVDGETPSQEQFGMMVERLIVSANSRRNSERWDQDQALTMTYSVGGQFAVRGASQPVRYRIKMQPFSNPGSGGRLDFLPLYPLEFTPGSNDLVLNLQTGGSLQAVLLTEDMVLMQNLFLQLSASDGQLHEEPKDERYLFPPPYGNRMYGQYSGSQGEENEQIFKWGTLWPGEYELEIYPRGAREPLVTISDLVITAGERARDPRLDPIDLRGKLRKIKISIQGEDGKMLPQSNYGRPTVFINDPAPDAELQGYSAQNSSAVIFTSEPFLDLLVVAQGFQPKELLGVREDQSVVMERFPEVLLRIAGGLPKLPDKHVLRVSLRKKGGQRDKRKVMSDYSSGGTLDRLLRPPNTLSPFNLKGDVRAAVDGDGKFSLAVILDTDWRGGISVSGVEPAEIEVQFGTGREQVFEIQVPEEGLKKAIERVKQR